MTLARELGCSASGVRVAASVWCRGRLESIQLTGSVDVQQGGLLVTSTLRRCLATMAVMAIVPVIGPALSQPRSPERASAATPEFVPLASPQRLLDSRPTGGTDDGLFAGIGVRPPGGVLELQVTGRAGVPADAESVALNVTADVAPEGGFLTVFPCGVSVPNASNLNYGAGDTIANLVIARIGVGGKVCLYNLGATHLIADVTGYFPIGAFNPLDQPRRLLDSRPTGGTDDGLFAGTGILYPNSTLALPVTGRVGVPANAGAVALNVTVVWAATNGFITVFPCGAPLPTASNVNYKMGQTIANAVIAKVGAGGAVCFYTEGATDLIVDVTGVFPSTTLSALDAPQRFDTRPGQSTVDGLAAGGGIRPAEGTFQLVVGGRGGVPANASAVILNVTAYAAAGGGFVTVHPAGTGRPNASNLNYRQAQTIANAAIARVGAGGQICLYTFGSTHLIVDVAGWLTGPPPPSSGAPCPADPTPPTTTMPPTTPPSSTSPTTTSPASSPGNTVNCSDFASQAEAQAWFDTYYPYYGDVAGLDGDGNGIVCESLP